ncbi:MAG: rhomboid family intramembrane serine protease [Lachnospiraceae bacterium]|nr:rhomboid family intramembrane serine protease [Lachnospiraceae bacterium]
MIAEIDNRLKANGYRFMKVQPEEAGIYYQYVNGTVRVVLGLLDHDTFQMNVSVYNSMKEHIRQLFFLSDGRVPGITEETPVYEVEVLGLVITGNIEKYRTLCSDIRGIWLIEKHSGRLIVYEDQPGDFYGLYGAIQNLSEQGQKKKEESSDKQFKKNHLTVGKVPFGVNTGIVVLNILIWLVMTFFGDTNDPQFLLEHGAMQSACVAVLHEWYRLFTSMFIHIGSMHLINNMVVLFFAGNILEKEVGKIRYLLLYLISGLGGGLLSLQHMLHTGDMAVSAGASGAIFGVIGALLFLAIKKKGKIGDLTVKGLLFMVVLSFYFGITSTGVDNWCHIGGFITGFVAAIPLSLSLQKRDGWNS